MRGRQTGKNWKQSSFGTTRKRPKRGGGGKKKYGGKKKKRGTAEKGKGGGRPKVPRKNSPSHGLRFSRAPGSDGKRAKGQKKGKIKKKRGKKQFKGGRYKFLRRGGGGGKKKKKFLCPGQKGGGGAKTIGQGKRKRNEKKGQTGGRLEKNRGERGPPGKKGKNGGSKGQKQRAPNGG